MFSFLFRSLVWFLRKTVAAAIIVTLSLIAYAMWLFLHDEVNLEIRRTRELAGLTAKRDELIAHRAEIDSRMEGFRKTLNEQQDRADRAGRVAENLKSLDSRWERWFGNAEQQRANETQRQHMLEAREKARLEVLQMQRALTQAAWEKDGVESALQPVERRITALEKDRSPAQHYLLTAWYAARWWIVVGLVIYFFGPWLLRFALYYGVAPFVSRGRGLLLAAGPQSAPTVTVSEGTMAATLWPGEVLTVRSSFLAEQPDGLGRARRALFDWRLPLTSLVSGLSGLVELHHHLALGEHRVTLTAPNPGETEFAMIQISEGSSMILRPKFLAGVIRPAGQRLTIRSRWRFFNRQCWAAAQFRFLEFNGPCRLIVAGPGPLRIEHLAPPEAGPREARRIAPTAAIGFTPDLSWALVRTQRLWNYLRGRDALVELSLAGPGLFLARGGAAPKRGRWARFLSARRDRLLRVFGA